jgi:hypothetical protein
MLWRYGGRLYRFSGWLRRFNCLSASHHDMPDTATVPVVIVVPVIASAPPVTILISSFLKAMLLVFLLKTGYAKTMIFEQTIETPELSGETPTTESLCGAAQDSTLTVERFMEMKREDIALENEIDERQWGAKW